MAEVRFEQVGKQFGTQQVLTGFDLTVDDGEFLVLLGPSGCGKTTALRMVAGLEEPTTGSILIGGKSVEGVAPQHRDVAMVFQSYALYPHLSVAKNIGFPLLSQDGSKDENQKKVREAAELLGLGELLSRKPKELSGGQRQRVALARAIVRSPRVFLMDEPLSNLDATLRTQTRGEIVQLQQRLGTTTIYVTHDQVEAMTMGDRIAVMNNGHLQQIGSPAELYEDPINTFVASFVGNPGMNLLRAQRRSGVIYVGDTATVNVLGADESIVMGVRSEDLQLSNSGVPGVCSALEVLGSEVHVHVDAPGGQTVVIRQAANVARPRLGETLSFIVTTESPLFFDALTLERLRA